MITVVNKRWTVSNGEYIGRPSPLGNPFIIGPDGDRDEVIAKYRRWLWLQMDAPDSPALAELNRLTDLHDTGEPLVLVCWCAPKPCHGDVLSNAITWLSAARTNGLVPRRCCT
jgi:hypothetical protein